jgi:hypothetical protein
MAFRMTLLHTQFTIHAKNSKMKHAAINVIVSTMLLAIFVPSNKLSIQSNAQNFCAEVVVFVIKL